MDQHRVFCEHCSEFVSRKTRYNHQKLKSESKYAARKRRFEQLDAEDELMNPKRAINQLSETCGRIHVDRLTNGEVDNACANVRDDACSEDKSPGVDADRNADICLDADLENDETEAETRDCTITDNAQEKQRPDYGFTEDRSTEEEATCETNIQSEKPRTDKGPPSPSEIVSWIITSVLSIQLSHNISDACVMKFLLLLSQIFTVLAPFSKICELCSRIIPSTLYAARKLLNLDRDNFRKYIVCPNCCAIYSFDSVVHEVNGNFVVKKCVNQVYSCRSADQSSRKKGKVNCNTTLVEKVILKNGKETYSPLKVYCFNSVIESLENMLKRPNFIENCNAWRNRNIPTGVYADVFDGNMWKSFMNTGNSDFLSKPHDFGCMINVDWYQPFGRRHDQSVGAIYMVFLNLPREERFKKENCVLIGILPALSKEPESLTSFLEPLVSELKALWRGVPVCLPGQSTPVTVRMALMCAAADIPAARKLCGFLGHSAIQGCSHCSKPMWTKGRHDCGLPDLDKWPARSREEHLIWTEKAKSAETLTKRKDIEKCHGYRYTPLLQLPYFIPSRMTAIDPMHNLFLGTAKKMFAFWIEKEYLTNTDLRVISSRIQSVRMPSNIGRIPTNISTNYGQMTAKEWKNWVLVYSLFCLHGILDSVHLRIWHTFVLACRHFCQPVIRAANLDIGSNLMAKFCREVSRHYGKEFITPNMHLHCHLQESVHNFGSIYGFWLFSFERYNGILTDMPTNKKELPVQLMRKFSMFSLFHGDAVSAKLCDNYRRLSEMSPKKPVLLSTPELSLASSSLISEIAPAVWNDFSLLKLSVAETQVSLTNDELSCLQTVYCHLYQKNVSGEMLSQVGQKLPSISWCNSTLSGDSQGGLSTNGIVSAMWADDQSRISTTSLLRPAKINYFVVHNLLVSGHAVRHVFACVEWFKRSDEQFGYLNPISVWSSKLQNDGPATYVPIQRLDAKCAWFEEVRNSHRYIVTCPLSQAVYM